MDKRAMISYPLVLIEWQDSAQPIANWMYLEDLEEQKPIDCISVGWLVKDGKTVKSIAQNLGDVGTEDSQAMGITRIATRSIVKMRRLK